MTGPSQNGNRRAETHMQKINAANWISAARSCSPASTPCTASTLAAMSERRAATSDRLPASR
ncbi:MAG: hypothetical protein WDN06_21750 [Asticcacaulis sp.]